MFRNVKKKDGTRVNDGKGTGKVEAFEGTTRRR